VLAVGDAEFQKKCLGKMNDVAKGEGRTVLFVSHNMAAVKSLCSKGILLSNGNISLQDNIEKVIEQYNNDSILISKAVYNAENTKKESYIDKIYLYNEDKNKIVESIGFNDDNIYLNVILKVRHQNGYMIGFTLYNNEGIPLLSTPPLERFTHNNNFKVSLKIKIPVENLKAGHYFIEGAFSRHNEIIDKSDNFISFMIEPKSDHESKGYGIKGLFLNNNNWIFYDI